LKSFNRCKIINGILVYETCYSLWLPWLVQPVILSFNGKSLQSATIEYIAMLVLQPFKNLS